MIKVRPIHIVQFVCLFSNIIRPVLVTAKEDLSKHDYAPIFGELRAKQDKDIENQRVVYEFLHNKWVVDVSKYCTIACFLAHSCDPNCERVLVQSNDRYDFCSIFILICFLARLDWRFDCSKMSKQVKH